MDNKIPGLLDLDFGVEVALWVFAEVAVVAANLVGAVEVALVGADEVNVDLSEI